LYNFFSHTHIIFLFSLFLFLSPLFLTNKKREQQSCPRNCTKIVVQISLLFLESNGVHIIKCKSCTLHTQGRRPLCWQEKEASSNINPQSNTIILARERSINVALLTVSCWRSVCSAVRLIITRRLSLTPIVEIHKEGWKLDYLLPVQNSVEQFKIEN